MANVSIHTPAIPKQHAAESEAKLKKALSKNAASVHSTPMPQYVTLPPSQSSHGHVMMRKPIRTKLQA
ncbi:hypothetical protein HETIRDRAFT_412453 [Heterobasidion irregulare TC 32-1]|uniref:Uncharacterized protein n=1 Tax=Heterobasidion irregulare (strain TC 32-1) TaxID=747525 RepID=W4JNY2_HETIT|nr:uncharacterized protein HETIRDRAFT_412453 [Heterobasidion irregulare TC 32-1]ETW75253.1 hypothetical protein HETIRDRAFT_412453 [Heterobasidion irregulare TC 32-1]